MKTKPVKSIYIFITTPNIHLLWYFIDDHRLMCLSLSSNTYLLSSIGESEIFIDVECVQLMKVTTYSCHTISS